MTAARVIAICHLHNAFDTSQTLQNLYGTCCGQAVHNNLIANAAHFREIECDCDFNLSELKER